MDDLQEQPVDELLVLDCQDGSRKAMEAADLSGLLPRLSNVARTVLTLHYLEGFGLADIARIQQVPQGTVKSRLHAARNELRSLIKETTQ